MGYIEDVAAKEVARQNEGRARAAQAAQVMNQNPGLAASIASGAGYQLNGLTDREANEIAQRNAIAQKMYEQAAAEQYAKSKAYENTLRNAGQAGWDGRSGVVVPQGNVDPGLAAKYAADRENFR